MNGKTLEWVNPYEPKKSCSHDRPEFGCRPCIEKDKIAWASGIYEAWKKTYKPPKCPECSAPMTPYDYGQENGVVVAEVLCTRFEGDNFCDGEIRVRIGEQTERQ